MALRVHERYDQTDGPAICDGDGYLMTHHNIMNLMLWEIMEEELYLENPCDFPASIGGVEDIREKIQIVRIMRRMSDTQALRKGISQADINIMNQWADDIKKKKKSSAHLYITYAQHDLLNDVYKHFSSVVQWDGKRSIRTTGGICQTFSPSDQFVFCLSINYSLEFTFVSRRMLTS